jgi:hypothetical protein
VKSEVWVPGAQLIESMRAVGYSTLTAVADIIDNSITAKARTIEILVHSDGENPYIAVLDDGTGMHGDAARHAMQLAGNSSSGERRADDLGRFGLGLKTASWSQCKRLTLVTKVDGEVSSLAWDLDFVSETQEWRLLVLEEEDYSVLPEFERLSGRQHGTLILWEKLDRFPDGPGRSRVIDQTMVDVRDHLALVFHRFLAGEAPLEKLSIVLNGTEIEAADPFLSKSPRTQVSRQETLLVDGQQISVQAYTLPYLNKMSAADRQRAQIAGGIRDSQGFYVYRGGRLVIWGTWFRLMPKTDMGKLARVKVDIPNSLDHLWSLDIKKSSAVPPSIVKDRLRALAASMIEPSQKVHKYRGLKNAIDDPITRPWNLVLDRDNFRYEVNREHPALISVLNQLDQDGLRHLEMALRIIEGGFPVQDLHNRMSGDAVPTQETVDLELLRGILKEMWLHSRGGAENAEQFVTRMLAVEPLHQLKTEHVTIVQELEASEGKASA